MGTNNSIINKTELDGIISRRVVVNHEDLRNSHIFGRIINHTLDLGNASRNSNTYIGNLIFADCTFNEAVNIGGSDDSNITFKHCIFNGNVQVISNKVMFEDGCHFKRDFMVSSYSSTYNKSFSITNITVDGRLHARGSIENISRINLEKNIQDQTLIVDSELSEVHFSDVIFKETQIKTSQEKAKVKLEGLNCNILTFNNVGEAFIEQSTVLEVNFVPSEIGSKKLHISNESVVDAIIIPLTSFDKIDISNSTVAKLKLSGNNMEKGIVNISKVRIKQLEFEKCFQ